MLHSRGTNGDVVGPEPCEATLEERGSAVLILNLKEIGSRTCQLPGCEGGEAGNAPLMQVMSPNLATF